MENISVVKISKVDYYLSDDLMINCPAFFKGCRNAREVINKKENELLKKELEIAKLQNSIKKSKSK